MCGIAGLVNLNGTSQVPPGVLRRMSQAIVHRGPDEDGYFEPGDMTAVGSRRGLAGDAVGLASRRLSIVGLFDGKQPITNEDRQITVVFNGELFDYPEVRAQLQAKGHQFRTHCDTELLPHLWEDNGESMLEKLRGQFAIALVGPAPPPFGAGPRPVWHLSVVLDTPGRLAALRFGDQGPHRLGHGAGAPRSAGDSPHFHVFRPAWASDVFRGNSLPGAGPVSVDSARPRRRSGTDRRADLLAG